MFEVGQEVVAPFYPDRPPALGIIRERELRGSKIGKHIWRYWIQSVDKFASRVENTPMHLFGWFGERKLEEHLKK